jgi:hypothetical protein
LQARLHAAARGRQFGYRFVQRPEPFVAGAVPAGTTGIGAGTGAFFGFLASLLPCCCPLGMTVSLSHRPNVRAAGGGVCPLAYEGRAQATRVNPQCVMVGGRLRGTCYRKETLT